MKAFLRCFTYAAHGIRVAVREERNLRFHLCAAAYVLLFSLFYPFGRVEYCILLILVGGVLALELVNSALERTLDKLVPQRSHRAGLAKDMAAGAVLVYSIAAAICGVVLFWQPAVLRDILWFFWQRPPLLLLLLASFAPAYLFTFRYNRKKG